MPQYDVYSLSRTGTLVVDCQSDYIDHFETRVVAPLVSASAKPVGVRQLHPAVSFQGQDYLIAIHLMAATPETELGRPVGNLMRDQDAIGRAREILFTGF